MHQHKIPLFPLHAVLFPGGVMSLRIFEPRYLDMISSCMKSERPFGVVQILEGTEAGSAARTYDVGTLVSIDYFHTRSDGLLGITVRGSECFRITNRIVQPNQLILATVELLPREASVLLPARFQPLAEMLSRIIQHLGQPYLKLVPHFYDAGWVSARLSEILPISLQQKQYFLHLSDPLQRLEELAEVLEILEMK